MPLYTELRHIISDVFKESMTITDAVVAVIDVLEASNEVELLQDEMKLVVIIRKPKWRDMPFPSVEAIDGVLHSGGSFSSYLEFEFRAYPEEGS